MEITQIFNILLLTLSLATILLTLISYLIYRVRQLPTAGDAPSTLKTQGAFFSRYVPPGMLVSHSPSAAVPVPVSAWRKKLGIWLPKNAFVFFGITVSVIFTCLLFQSFIRNRSKTADGGAMADYVALQKRGLLRSFEWVETAANHDAIMNEALPSTVRKRIEHLATELHPKKVVLLSTTANGSRNLEAIARWKAFLGRFGIRSEVQSSLETLSADALVILPELSILSDAERVTIEKALARKIPFLASGPIATGNSPGALLLSDWSEKIFGIKFVTSSSDKFYPTFFATKPKAAGPLWNVPPGMLVDLKPEENKIRALATHGYTGAYEADFNGFTQNEGALPSVRAQFVGQDGHRAAWLAFAPPAVPTASAAHLPTADNEYVDDAILSSLAWTAQIPTPVVPFWKDALPSALLLSVDSEDQFQNVEFYAKLFKNKFLPATFFVVAELFQKNPTLFGQPEQIPASLEIESHSENHAEFPGLTAENQFDRIQTSRLEIEEITHQRVRGFRAPAEKFDNATVNAAVQNHLVYFAGNNRFHRLAPVWVADGKLLYYPRIMADDFAIHNRTDVHTSTEISDLIVTDAHRVAQVGGLYLLNLHTHVFGRDEFHAPLEIALTQLAQEPSWKVNYAELTDWWKARSSLDLSIESAPTGGLILTVKNLGTQRTPELAVELDLGAFDVALPSIHETTDGANVEVDRALSSVSLAAPGETRILRVGAIDAHRQRTYLIK